MIMQIKIALGMALLAGTLAGCAPALHQAAESGDLQQVRLLLDQGADVNEHGWQGGWTALHWAAYRGNLEVAQLLLERKADVNAKMTYGQTPLFWAAENGHKNMVQLLLDRGADCCDVVSGAGWGKGLTPLKAAQERGDVAIVRLLEQAEARQLGPAPPVASSPASPSPAPSAAVGVSTSDVDTPPARRAKARPNAYAVVVGIEQYQQKLPKADFAAHDAEIMGQYLTKTLGYAEENVVVLLNDRATKTGVEKYIEHWLPDRVEKDASVFIYYSGHGAPNPKTSDAYLMPYDGDPAFVDATGYPLKRLYERLGKLPAKNIVVMLDSCFSGAGGRSVIAEGARPMMLSIENPILAGNKTVVLAASSGTQISSTFKEQGHGLLTYYFLKGLRGEADANKDGSVDLAEVFAYLKPQVERTARRDYHNEQTPQLLGSPELLTKGVKLIEPVR